MKVLMPQMSPMNWMIIMSLLIMMKMTYYTNMPTSTKPQGGKAELKKKQKLMKW